MARFECKEFEKYVATEADKINRDRKRFPQISWSDFSERERQIYNQGLNNGRHLVYEDLVTSPFSMGKKAYLDMLWKIEEISDMINPTWESIHGLPEPIFNKFEVNMEENIDGTV